MSAATPERGGARVVLPERYRIEHVIGRGGTAVVYAAHDTLLNRAVAIKVFTAPPDSARVLREQQREAQTLAGLTHHALVTLFDAGIDEADAEQPHIYLVMERIDGPDLGQRLRSGALTPMEVTSLGLDLCDALLYVHDNGWLHRDIKPANVLLADRGIDTRVRGKLADFGISSMIDGLPERTSGTGTGTAAYLSPEQVDEQEPTIASDVYSLGLVLLEALTGTAAFPGPAKESAIARLERDPVIPADVPERLAVVLRGMTALLPEERPSLTAVALAFQNATLQDLIEAGRLDPALILSQEDERVAAVRRYNILDTPPDDAFDRITRLACRLVDVPVALVGIVDADREWFKSRHGIDVSEIDRDVALCATTVATGVPYLVEDVQIEPRFARNPIVRGNPALRAFLSVPLRTSGGHAIGTLCVFDRRVRMFTAEEVDDLEQLAAMAVRELDLRLASRRAVFER